MRAYDDRYGFRDELDRPAPNEQKIARLDQDLSELALAFRQEKDSQKDDYYSVRNGLTTLIRLLMIDDLRKITVEPSNTVVDIIKLSRAIDFYINSYAQYGIKLEIHVVETEEAKEMEARKDYSVLPIKEILTETTIVGVPEVLTRVVIEKSNTTCELGSVADDVFCFVNAVRAVDVARVIFGIEPHKTTADGWRAADAFISLPRSVAQQTVTRNMSKIRSEATKALSDRADIAAAISAIRDLMKKGQ